MVCSIFTWAMHTLLLGPQPRGSRFPKHALLCSFHPGWHGEGVGGGGGISVATLWAARMHTCAFEATLVRVHACRRQAVAAVPAWRREQLPALMAVAGSSKAAARVAVAALVRPPVVVAGSSRRSGMALAGSCRPLMAAGGQ